MKVGTEVLIRNGAGDFTIPGVVTQRAPRARTASVEYGHEGQRLVGVFSTSDLKPYPAKVDFSPATVAAMRRVIDYIGADLSDEDLADPEIVAEMALDADRLTMCVNAPEAQKEVRSLIAAFGWDAVLRAAAKVLGAYSK